MENTFCPYPGLRPYTEEESVYFKGRDEHIVAISKMLETKKFLMVTGASGDGKSSLIFAGVMPYARAGLLKANYNNWTLADFRPERSPLENLSKSVSSALKLDYDHVSQELQFGFSALIDLYKESNYYEDFTKEEWLSAGDDAKKKRKRECANLLILVDQFEEFFTNKENYIKGNPSDEAQNVVNLLLETANIAQANDIPIYIICTMRSDYIGQCASFRNLPEYIGHSHFFVPRLKRQEIRQVIEEPALLSGIEINSGLIEVLINSISDGFDQLPLLQHALHQIWSMAIQENGTMSLIHFAKIGGINKKILSESDQQIYDKWLLNQPEYKLNYLKKSGLGNTLDLHANELYETAYLLSKNNLSPDFTEEKVKIIIEKTFQCLTKIDDGRGVRNRMSVNEIRNILNESNVTLQEFSSVINIFRTQGNTFINPFIFNEEDEALSDQTILDITHESLIRNWDKLKEWAVEEDKSFQTYIDFKKQLDRWNTNEKSRGYLLPIGPLTHFEEWNSKANINKFWIKKYESQLYTEEIAQDFIENSRNFLKKSRYKNLFGLVLLKHGFEKVFNTFILGVVFMMTIYFWFDTSKKNDKVVLNTIYERTEKLYTSSYVSINNLKEYLFLREIDEKGKGLDLLSKMDDTLAIETAFAMLGNLHNIDFSDDNYFMKDLHSFLIEKSNKLNKLKYFNALLLLENQFLQLKFDFVDENQRNNIVKKVYKRINEEIELDSITNPNDFVASLRYLSYYQNVEGVDIKKILYKMNPFDSSNTFFNKNFAVGTFAKLYDWQGSPKYSNNGGYLALAYLSIGNDPEIFNKSIDSLLINSEEAFTNNDYYNHNSWMDLWKIGAINSEIQALDLITKIINIKNVKDEEINVNLEMSLNRFISYMYPPFISNKNYWKSSYLSFGNVYLNLSELEKINFEIFKRHDLTSLSKDQKLFAKAMNQKFFTHYLGYYDDSIMVYQSLEKADKFYDSISDDYKAQKYDLMLNSSNASSRLYVSSIYYLPNVLHQENSTYEWERSNTDVGINKKNIFISKLLKSDVVNIDSTEYSKLLNEFIYTNIIKLENEFSFFDTIEMKEMLKDLKTISLKTNTKIDTLAFNLFLNILGEDNWNLIDTSKFLNNSYINGSFFNETSAKNCLIGNIAKKRSTLYNTSSYITYITEESLRVKFKLKLINYLLELDKYDKSLPYLNEIISIINTKNKFPNYLTKVLGHLDGEDFNKLALYLIKNVKDEKKPKVLKFYFEGLLKNKSNYDAIQLISSQTSDDTELLLLNQIIRQKIVKEKSNDSIWTKYLKVKDWSETSVMYDMDNGDNYFFF
jgi:energy-coupling factor transporter ATP-binding protein EcfA2